MPRKPAKQTREYMANLEKRFWSQVRKTTSCWEWIGYVGKNGRGYISARALSNPAPIAVHRLSWILHFGPIPKSRWVCHHCDNPICVRPDHLFLGTPSDNTQDMISKGRMRLNPPKGEGHGMARLTEQDVLKIRKASGQGATNRELGERFGVQTQTIRLIVTRKLWKHI